jgi:pullulanase
MSHYTAWIDDVHLITIPMDELHPLREQLNKPPVIYWEKKETYFPTEFYKTDKSHSVQLTVQEELPIGEELTLLWSEWKMAVYPRHITRTVWFDKNYAAKDALLGPAVSEKETVFRVWTPVALQMDVNVEGTVYPLNRGERGIWTLTLSGDWHGARYHFEGVINGKKVSIADPYAKGMAANSESAILIDFSRTLELSPFNDGPKHPTDAIIYELHVRDATIHPNSGVKNRGKYLGLTEKGTTTATGYSTGLSYFKELGVTHLELLPIHDYARVPELEPENGYNWGYDPLHFQVPEGSYSALPDSPTARINELKKMIQAMHEENLCVIQDVVFNHIYKIEESEFEKLVPGYYFRYHEDGRRSDGTGVGNDFATEKEMMRKFILDTIDFLLREYKFDGFRFDLMGVMDIKTMQAIKKRCEEEDRMILLLGEGWDLPTALDQGKKAITAHASHLKGIGFFNDYFRDSLKGNLFERKHTGFINGEGRYIERMPDLVRGSVLGGSVRDHSVSQSVNYVESHDNHTLWDRLAFTNEAEDVTVRKKMHQLGTALTILSQGIPFLHAGQEFFRTKYGDGNSYISGDAINQLNWKRREMADENIDFVRSLIRLRRENPVFRLRSKKDIDRRVHTLEAPHPVFAYVLLGIRKDIAVCLNPGNEKRQVRLPSSGNWRKTVSNIKGERTFNELYFNIEEYEIIVLEKDR